METIYKLDASSEQEVWQQVSTDIAAGILEYAVVLKEPDTAIVLSIEIDPGGGFEGGYAFTRLTADVGNRTPLKLSLHHQGVLAEVGKWLGMQDVQVGDAAFDEKVVVKTNDEALAKQVLSEPQSRSAFQNLKSFDLHISHNDEERMPILKLEIEDAILDVDQLKSLYIGFRKLLLKIREA